MSLEARIELETADFVASGRSVALLSTATSSELRHLWDFCSAKIEDPWRGACSQLSEHFSGEASATTDQAIKRYLARSRRRVISDNQWFDSFKESEGLETVVAQSGGLLRDRCMKCFESVRALRSELQIQSGFNVVRERREHLISVGLRYLLPLAAACEDFGAEGVFACVAAMYEIAGRYKQVAYHNAAHAALVTHHCVEIARVSGVWACLTSGERLSLVFACVGHDIGHPGLGSSLYHKSRHPLALLYNDRHILENYHAALLLQILANHNYSPALHPSLREPLASRAAVDVSDGADRNAANLKLLIIQCVIWTDLTDHARIMKTVISTFEVIKATQLRGAALREWIKKMKPAVRDATGLVMKMADVSYFALPDPLLMIEWCILLYGELYSQRQLESANGLPVCEALGVGGLGTRKWFEANLVFCSEVVMPMASTLLSFSARLCDGRKSGEQMTSAEILGLSQLAEDVLAEEQSGDWYTTALALKARDQDGATPDPIKEAPASTFVKVASKWIGKQQLKGASDQYAATVLVPLKSNIEVLQKARYAN